MSTKVKGPGGTYTFHKPDPDELLPQAPQPVLEGCAKSGATVKLFVNLGFASVFLTGKIREQPPAKDGVWWEIVSGGNLIEINPEKWAGRFLAVHSKPDLPCFEIVKRGTEEEA